LQPAAPDHYATLGLDRDCADSQIRAAYRLLAKQHHPDVNGGSRAAVARTQALNAAYEILSDPARRREYDRELAARKKPAAGFGKSKLNLTKEVHLRIEDFLRGTTLEVTVNDFASQAGVEKHELIVPPDTAPGTRFRLPRNGGGFIIVRVKARPDFRFKVRGSDLRCDLKIKSHRASQGGVESLRGVTGNYLRVVIPPKVARGDILHTPDVRIRRT
jgi:DnaJ-class molecular chaperone